MSDHERDDDVFEQSLHRGFQALRTADAAQAPAFAALFARAAADASSVAGTETAAAATPATPTAATTATAMPLSPAVPNARARRTAPTSHAARTAIWATPLLVAAALAVVVLSPARRAERAAEREFEALVSEWTNTTERADRLPTDGLLALPGSEYLRTLPAIGGGGDVSGTRRPS